MGVYNPALNKDKRRSFAECFILTPQQQVALCPVCNGSGQYKEHFNDYGISTRTYIIRTCHGCGGKGWVVVPTTYGIR